MFLPDSTLVKEVATAVVNPPADVPLGAIEQVMLADDKIFVVLAVVLMIWTGLILLVLRTDRRLQTLEERIAVNFPPPPSIS